MSIKEVVVCDGCGRHLEKTSEIFHLNLKTDKFWDVVEMDYRSINLDFCPRCAHEIKETLKKIASKMAASGEVKHAKET